MNLHDMLLFTTLRGNAGGGSGGDNFPIGDGNTHIWISLAEGRTSPRLRFGGSATVDWGDGSEPYVVENAHLLGVTHDYEKSGDYIISIVSDGKITFSGNNNRSNVLGSSTSTDINDYIHVAYCDAITRIECAENVSLSTKAFHSLYSLKDIVLPKKITEIPQMCFAGCYGVGVFVIPPTVSVIGSSAFPSPYGVRYFDFTQHTSVPSLTSINSIAISYLAADCEIRVPAALYDEWIAATNWSAYGDHIVGV